MSATSAPAPVVPSPRKPTGKTSKLMIECGSAGWWTPESNENVKWVMTYGSPNDRVVAAVRARSVQRGFRWIVNDDGSPGNAKTLAADTGYALKTIHNIVSEERRTGRIGRVDDSLPGRICYGGNPQNPPGSDGRTNSEEHSPVQGNRPALPMYVSESIKSVPEARREDAEAFYRRAKAAFFADAEAQARAIFHAQVEPIIFERAGLSKDRLPVRESPEAKWVQLSLLDIDSLVQGNLQANPEGVVQNGKAPRYAGKNGVVHHDSDPVLYSLEKEEEKSTLSVGQVSTITEETDGPIDTPLHEPKLQRNDASSEADQLREDVRKMLVEEMGEAVKATRPHDAEPKDPAVNRVCRCIAKGARIEQIRIELRSSVRELRENNRDVSYGWAPHLCDENEARWIKEAREGNPLAQSPPEREPRRAGRASLEDIAQEAIREMRSKAAKK